jgi:hypothetical protein
MTEQQAETDYEHTHLACPVEYPWGTIDKGFTALCGTKAVPADPRYPQAKCGRCMLAYLKVLTGNDCPRCGEQHE